MTIKAVVFDAYGTLYDVQSVADITEDAFPGYGDIITQVWRIKQLEYTWLRSLMRRYRDFSEVTRDALAYTLDSLGLQYDDDSFARIIDKYLHLDLYPDALAALSAMKDRKLAILSNGSPDMLDALVRNSGLDRVLDAVISVDAKKIFKPSPEAYMLIEEVLHVPPAEVLFISANPWDACGAKAFGLNVAWIERVTPEAMALACLESETLPPLTMFWALRTQMDELGVVPDHRIHGLAELPALVSAHKVLNMSLESVRAFFAEKAPDISVIESPMSSATVDAGRRSLWRRAGADRQNAELADRRARGADRGRRHLADGQQEGEGAVRRKAENARPRGSRRDHRARSRRRLSVRIEDAAAGLLRRLAEGVRHRGAGRGLDPQRGEDYARAHGGTDRRRMGRRLRTQARAGSASGLFVFLTRTASTSLENALVVFLIDGRGWGCTAGGCICCGARAWRRLLRRALRRLRLLLLFGAAIRTPRGNHWRAAACSAANMSRSG